MQSSPRSGLTLLHGALRWRPFLPPLAAELVCNSVYWQPVRRVWFMPLPGQSLLSSPVLHAAATSCRCVTCCCGITMQLLGFRVPIAGAGVVDGPQGRRRDCVVRLLCVYLGLLLSHGLLVSLLLLHLVELVRRLCLVLHCLLLHGWLLDHSCLCLWAVLAQEVL